MGDTNMDNVDGLVDYNEIDPNTGQPYNVPNKDDKGPSDEDDCTLDIEQQEQHQAKYGDSVFYAPYVPKPPRGSVEDIQHKLRISGTRLRKSLNRSLTQDPQAWTALRRPASLHSAQRTLAEMLVSVPSADHEHFHELGDGHVCMPLHTMEKYLYPTLRVMQELHSLKGRYEYLPGGVESMIVYSFFQQGGRVAQNLTEQDLRLLRNTIFPAGSDLPDQLRVNAEVTEGLSTHLRSTLRRLREMTVMPSIDKLENMTGETLDERQAEIDALLGIYTEQITKDYHACRLDKERLILLSHLSQQQSLEVLEAHLQLARVMESNQIHVKQSVERELMLRTAEMEKHICEMLDQNRKAIRFSLMEAAEQITPYDVEDMKKVLESQKEMTNNITMQNAQLVMENSELRTHLSFMPVEYRDYVRNMQSNNHQEYRNQRRSPKVIVPNADHREGCDIELEDAPMSHPSVQHLFRDARHCCIAELRQQVDRGFALRQRVLSEPYKLEAPWRVDLPPQPSPAPAPPPAASQRDGRVDYQRLMAAAHKTPQNYVPSPPNAATAVPTT
mgnify:FL=1